MAPKQAGYVFCEEDPITVIDSMPRFVGESYIQEPFKDQELVALLSFQQEFAKRQYKTRKK